MQAQIQKNADLISQAQPTQAQPTQATTEGATIMTQIQNIIESLAQEGKFTATKLDLSVSVNGFDIKVKAKNVEITTTAKPTQSATATSTADTDDLISFKAFSERMSKSMQSVADRIAPNTFIIGADNDDPFHDTFAVLFLNTDVFCDPLLDIYVLNTHEESDYAHLGANIVHAVEQIRKCSSYETKLLKLDDWFKLTYQGSEEGFFKRFEEDIKTQAHYRKHSIEGLKILAKRYLDDGEEFSWNSDHIFQDIGLEDGVRIGNQLVKAKLSDEWGCVPYDFEIINLK